MRARRHAFAATLSLLVVPSLAWVLLSPVGHRRSKTSPHAGSALMALADSARRSRRTTSAAPLPRATTARSESAEATIAGVVVDAAGSPVEGATVGCDDVDREVTKVDTGPDGKFRLPAEALGCRGV